MDSFGLSICSCMLVYLLCSGMVYICLVSKLFVFMFGKTHEGHEVNMCKRYQ